MFSLKDRVALGDRRIPGHRARNRVGTCCGRREGSLRGAQRRKNCLVSSRKLPRRAEKLLAVQMDVAEADQIKAGFKKVHERFERLDILVNNAAITRDMLALRMKLEDWDAVLRTNLTGAYLCIQQAMGVMLRQRYGRIVNVSSVVAETGNAGQANYVAAKAGLIGLTRAMAVEIASRSITVNAVAPGFISTPMTDPLAQRQ